MIKRFLKRNIITNIILIVISLTVWFGCLFFLKKVHLAAQNDIIMSILFLALLTVIFCCIATFTYFATKLGDIIYNKWHLAKVKKHLNNDLKTIRFKTDGIPELHALIINNCNAIIKARIDNNNVIHIVIEYAGNSGLLYHGETTNYEWFLKNVSF